MSQGPPPYPSQPPGPPPPPQYAPPYVYPVGPPPRRNGGLIAIVAIAAVIALAGGVGEVAFLYSAFHRGPAQSPQSRSTPSPSPSPTMETPVTADSKLLANGGTLIYQDDFHDPASGWPTGPSASGTTYSYTNAGYVVVGKGDLHHIAHAPYDAPVTQLGISMTATQDADAPAGAGFGVSCIAGAGETTVRYEILLLLPGAVFVERRTGAQALTTPPALIKEVSAPASPGAVPITVVGMCATLPDGHTTRVAVFVNGHLVVDVSDFVSQTVAGWVGGLAFASRTEGSSTETVTLYTERDLDR